MPIAVPVSGTHVRQYAHFRESWTLANLWAFEYTGLPFSLSCLTPVPNSHRSFKIQYEHCCLFKYFPYSRSFHWFCIIQVNQQLQSNVMISLLKCKLREVGDWVFPFTQGNGLADSFIYSISHSLDTSWALTISKREHLRSVREKSKTSALSTMTHTTVTESDSSWISSLNVSEIMKIQQ